VRRPSPLLAILASIARNVDARSAGNIAVYDDVAGGLPGLARQKWRCHHERKDNE